MLDLPCGERSSWVVLSKPLFCPCFVRVYMYVSSSKFCFSKSKSSSDPCFDAGGKDISSQSKRDVGVQLAVTITYSNKYVLMLLHFHPRSHPFRCARGMWCIISHDWREGPAERDIGYSITAKY
jgi:hypothetical protein